MKAAGRAPVYFLSWLGMTDECWQGEFDDIRRIIGEGFYTDVYASYPVI